MAGLATGADVTPLVGRAIRGEVDGGGDGVLGTGGTGGARALPALPGLAAAVGLTLTSTLTFLGAVAQGEVLRGGVEADGRIRHGSGGPGEGSRSR